MTATKKSDGSSLKGVESTQETASPSSVARNIRPAMEMVLGGGGIKGLAHVGFLNAVEELNVKYGKITGVSIGSLVAAFFTNGYSPDQIEKIFVSELTALNPQKLARSMLLPPRLEKMVFGSEPFSLHKFMGDLVAKYQLKTRQRLRIVAFNAVTRKPVVFQGLKYNLVDALTASCALPYLFSPVVHGKKGATRAIIDYWMRGEEALVLVDGGLHHPSPGEFAAGKAIIAKLGWTRVPAPKHLPRADRLLHQLEYSASGYLDRRHPDPKGHFLIEVGHPEIASMTFNITDKQRRILVDNAYVTGKAALAAGISCGEIPVKKRRVKKQLKKLP